MGNTTIANEFKSGKWQIVQNLGNREILQNLESHMQVEKHFTMSNFKSFDDRFKNTQIFKWRKQLGKEVNVIKLFDFQVNQEMFGIQQDQFVYTQKIWRFNSKARIFSKPEGFLLLNDFLIGLQILYEFFGMFNPDVFLLGVSPQGKGKVWVNENYAKNQVDEKNIMQSKNSISQLVIVNNLIRLVKQRVYNQNFMPEIQFPLNMQFREALQYIRVIRNQHILFRVDKVYLDRTEFKQFYDMLYGHFIEESQNNYRNNVPVPIQNNVPASNSYHFLQQNSSLQQKNFEKQKSQSMMKTKPQPSQTLSSDSNSRTKKQMENTKQSDQIINIEKNKIQHSQKINIKEMIDEQNCQKSPIQEVQEVKIPIQNQQYRNLQQRVQISSPIMQQKYLNPQGRPMNTLTPQNAVYRQPEQLMFVNNNFQGPPIMQRRIIQQQSFQQSFIPHQARMNMQGGQQIPFHRPQTINHPLNSQIQNISQVPNALNPSQNIPQNNQGFYINNQPPGAFLKQGPVQVPQQVFPSYNQQYAQIQNPNQISRPNENITQQNFNNQRPVSQPMKYQKAYFPLPQIQQDPFIQNPIVQNVELCQSVIFDRQELNQNLADLDK